MTTTTGYNLNKIFHTNLNCFCSKLWFGTKIAYLLVIVFEWAHSSSNSSLVEPENFEFDHIKSTRNMNFLSLSLSLKTSLPSCPLNISSILSFMFFQVSQNYKPSNSNFIEFEFWVVELVKFSSSELLVQALLPIIWWRLKSMEINQKRKMEKLKFL